MDPKRYEEIKNEIAEFANPEMLFADGLEDALIGTPVATVTTARQCVDAR